MDSFSEMQTALKSDLNVSNNSSLFPTATLKLALNRAYIKAGRLFRWPQLEDALKTTTQANWYYYDAPRNWSPDSMWRVEVNDEVYGEEPDHSAMDYHDFLDWRADEDNENSTDLKWATQWLRFFIYPTPTVAGLQICVWGQKNVSQLVNDSDTTIFSYNSPEGNEAIVMEAREILKLKGEDDKAKNNELMLSPKALGTLTTMYNKIRQETAKVEKTQPFFHVTDMFGRGNSRNLIGRFDI